ncbi:hypothetical protein AAMO2058_001662100 [Amorphochlora amoebiformis]
MPTLIIPGNHDLNLKNRETSDSLLSILHRVTLDNVMYLRDSGVYCYRNLIFGISSVIDDEIVTIDHINTALQNQTQTRNFKKIALFHGTVDGARTDLGFQLPGHTRASSFDGYDVALLGDVHKFQYLDKDKRVAYAGSLIQQNHGESENNHGFLLWDLKNSSSHHVSVPNSYGFRTLHIDNAALREREGRGLGLGLPEHTRVRFELANTSVSEFLSVLRTLQNETNILEYTVRHSQSAPLIPLLAREILQEDSAADLKNLSENVGFSHDILEISQQIAVHQPATQQLLVREHFKEKNITDSILLEGIMERFKGLQASAADSMSAASGEFMSTPKEWKLSSLSFSNMFCYGGENELNFDELSGVVGILGSNHIGKSAILDIVLFCLFDRCSRGLRTEIINRRHQTCRCQLDFRVGRTIYRIVRSGRRNAKTVKIDAEFYRFDPQSGSVTCLNGVDRFETNRKICEIVGTYEDFIGTNIVLQSSIASFFLNLTPGKRKQYLGELLRLNVFEPMHEESRDQLKSRKTTLSDLRRQIQELTDAWPESKQEILTSTKNKLEHEVERYREDIAEGRKKLEENLSQLVPVPADLKEGYGVLESSRDVVVGYLAEIEKDIEAQQMAKQQATETLERIAVTEDELAKAVEEERQFSLEQNEKLNDLRATIKSKYLNLKNTEKSIASATLAHRKRELEKVLESYTAREEEVTKQIQGANETLSKIATDMEDLHDLAANWTNREPAYVRERWLIANESRIHTEISHQQHMQRLLEDHTFDPNCPFCANNSFLAHAKDAEEKLMQLDSELRSSEDQIASFAKREKDQKLKIQKYWTLKKEESVGRDRLTSMLLHSQRLESDKSRIEMQLEQTASLLETAIQSEKTDRENVKVKAEIQDLEAKFESTRNAVFSKLEDLRKRQATGVILERKINTADMRLVQYAQARARKETELIRLEAEILRRKDAVENLRKNKQIQALISSTRAQVLNWEQKLANAVQKSNKIDVELMLFKEKEKEKHPLLTEATSKTGVPSRLLERSIMALQEMANGILLSVADFQIAIENKKDGLEIFIRHDGRSGYVMPGEDMETEGEGTFCSVGNGSGYERFIVGLAIQIALSWHSQKSRPDFIAIDEGFGCLDSDNLARVGTIFDFLRQQYRLVLIITHIDKIKDDVDMTIEIAKESPNSDSLLTFGRTTHPDSAALDFAMNTTIHLDDESTNEDTDARDNDSASSVLSLRRSKSEAESSRKRIRGLDSGADNGD